MGAIAFSKKPEEQWAVAGWAFRQVLDDTISQHPEDPEMARQFEQAKDIGGLVLYLLEPGLAERIARAISETAAGILSGAIQSGIVNQRYGDARTVEEYQKGLQDLLKAVPTR